MIKDEIFRIYDFEFFSNKSNSFKWKESRLKKWKEGFVSEWMIQGNNEFESLITSRACETDRFQKRTNLYDISVSGEGFGTTRSRFSLIGLCPRYFIGPSNLNHN
ncbi:hypothetical protein T07_1387 [Trichinella nelsoni]|uniref:Uncharacterized protein n=1 Tax=Trichinella nelsoni TaxID=6336 RepID=A0A0V0RK59_9BILA|nr:hypothetical protein T07_1387 [Trichinella nelsoni]